MIIIETEKDINKLKPGDQFLIDPVGIDYNNPESILAFQEEIKNLEEAIYKIFSTEPKKDEARRNKRKK